MARVLLLLPLFCLLGVFQTVHALDNGLGHRPALGWNSDYCLGCKTSANGFQNEQFIKHIAKFINSGAVPNSTKTLQQLGYHYVNMDASWNTKSRDAHGNLVPDPALWPSGFKASVDFVHSLGLGFGIYGDRGNLDCAGNPGALGHEKQDAQFMLQNEIDFYKEDSCHASGDQTTAINEYAAMRDALNATGRPIWFALCGWETFYASDPRGGTKLANSARTGPDTGGGWTAVMQNVQNGLSVSKFAGPFASGGYWNDGSLQLLPGYLNHGQPDDPAHKITNDRHRSQFSMWCMLAMNILITGNLSDVGPFVLETWGNEEMLAVDQDALGRAAVELPMSSYSIGHGFRGVSDPKAYCAECGGEPELQNWTFGQPYAGHLSNAASKTCLNVDSCDRIVIYDVCETTGCGPNEVWSISDNGQIRSALDHGSKCLTLTSSGEVDILPCMATPDSSQKWTHDPASGQIRNGNGLCITGPGGPAPQDSLVMWRPLQNNVTALLFLNNGNSASTYTCGAACFAAIGLHDASASYTLRDLWLHTDIADHVSSTSGFKITVNPGGASRVVTLRSSSAAIKRARQ